MIVVKKPEMSEVASHVPDNLAHMLLPLLTPAKVPSVKCEITGLRKAAEEKVWVEASGIVIPCMYVLYRKKFDRADVRDELRKSCKKRQMEDTGSEPVKKCKML